MSDSSKDIGLDELIAIFDTRNTINLKFENRLPVMNAVHERLVELDRYQRSFPHSEERREPDAWALQMREGWWVGIWQDRDTAIDIKNRSNRKEDVVHAVWLLPIDKAEIIEELRQKYCSQLASINKLATEAIDAANARAAKAELALFDHTKQQKRLVREIDVAMHGDDAAEQASLCDIVLLVKRYFAKRKPRS